MGFRQANEGRKRRIIIIAPHADDAELGLGAYLHREVTTGRATANIIVVAETSDRRKDEQRMAAMQLGLPRDACVFLDAAKDSEFNLASAGGLVKALEQKIFTWVEIDELYIPLESFHEDHAVCHRAAIAALRPHKDRRFAPEIYAYEYPAQSWGPQPPSWGRVYARVAQQNIDAKLKALKCHHSQWVSDDQSLFGRKGVLALANMRGAECLSEYAELFYCLRGVK